MPAVTAVPESGILSDGFEPSDVIVTLPVALPAAVGVNLTLRVVFAPAATVTGVVIPLRLNPLPLTAACEIVTLAPPVFVSVIVCDWLVPTVTLVKVALVGFGVSCPGLVVIPDPVPVSVTLGSASAALVVILSVALNAPAALGVNSMVMGTFCPAAIVAGRLGETREKY